MDLLWSASTTMRNPERTYSFLKTIKEIEGALWDDETQMRLQSLLIKNRYYKPTKRNLSEQQISVLENLTYQMSYDEARDIFDSKKYTDAPMRGRTSFDPIEKLGLAELEFDSEIHGYRVRITKLGQMFLDNIIGLEDVVFSNLLKFQYPNPLTSDCKDYNTKPFINTLRLIKRVNELCIEKGLKAKGVSKDEFGIFVLSIKSYDEVNEKAETLLQYREKMSKLESEEDRQEYRSTFIKRYLSTFKEPVHNTKEYADNIIRYVRLTKFIYIRGGGYYIDLEPRRMVEINALLEVDNGSAKDFTIDEYKSFIANYHSYILPYETTEKLTIIAKNVIAEINTIEGELGLTISAFEMANNVTALKAQIDVLRDRRTALQNLKLKADYQEIDKIDLAITSLKNIRMLGIKPSVALEKWANIALNIINDALLIKPNSPLGDDNEPIFTAPAGVPDIECFYDGFGAICEVTMLTGRDQWFNEGQPVMRHLRDFETLHKSMDNYCLFVAPSLHQDTMNTFWNAVKYEYQGSKQKIIPLTISQLIDILQGIKSAKLNHRRVTKDDMKYLYESCTQLSLIPDSTKWSAFVTKQISNWQKTVVA